MTTYERHRYQLKRLEEEGTLQVAGLPKELGVTAHLMTNSFPKLSRAYGLKKPGISMPAAVCSPGYRVIL